MALQNPWNRVLRWGASSRRPRTTGQRRNGANPSRPNAKRYWQRLRPVLELLESRLTPNGVQYTALAARDPTSDDAILWTRGLAPAQPQHLNLIAEGSTDPTFGSLDPAL